MPTTRIQQERWSLQDEIRFINGIGGFRAPGTPAMNTTETLLRRYRKALEIREGASFDKTQALMLIDHRLEEILERRASALAGPLRQINEQIRA